MHRSIHALRLAPCAAGALLLSLPSLALAEGISGMVEANPAKFLEDTVVFVKDAPANHTPKTAVMDQHGLRFNPHVLTVTVGDTVKWTNLDTVGHNVISPDGGGYNLGTFGPHEERTRTFTKPGTYTQLCAVHPEMLCFIFVGSNPYSATVGADGRFTLPDLPPGTYHVSVWNPHLKAADQTITVAPGQKADVRFTLHR